MAKSIRKSSKSVEHIADLLVQVEVPFEVEYDEEDGVSPEDRELEEFESQLESLRCLEIIDSNYDEGDKCWDATGAGWFRNQSPWEFEIKSSMSVEQIDAVIEKVQNVIEVEGATVTEAWLMKDGKPALDLLNLRHKKIGHPHWHQTSKGDRQYASLTLQYMR